MGISENQIILVIVLTAIVIVAGSLYKLYKRSHPK
jgi:hypothetical protein